MNLKDNVDHQGKPEKSVFETENNKKRTVEGGRERCRGGEAEKPLGSRRL